MWMTPYPLYPRSVEIVTPDKTDVSAKVGGLADMERGGQAPSPA
jgi:hypothetical protein